MVCHLEERRKGSWSEWMSLAISSTLFAGFLPGAIVRRPGKGGGTAGALVALIVQFLFFGYSWDGLMLAMAVLTLFIGLTVVNQAEQFMFERWGPRVRHTGERVSADFNQTCFDEFHGQLVAGLPLWFIELNHWPRIVLLVMSFALFRILDAYKPWFIGKLERRYEGTALGIMIDDTAAGLSAAALVCFGLFVLYAFG